MLQYYPSAGIIATVFQMDKANGAARCDIICVQSPPRYEDYAASLTIIAKPQAAGLHVRSGSIVFAACGLAETVSGIVRCLSAPTAG
jgi:hypothetical protein